jgi:NADH-quinone oxidoreductase subunit M
MPVFAGIYLIIVMGSAGLPALSGFVGEFLTIFGTFNAGDTFPPTHPNFLPAPRLLGALAATGVIFGAIYLLYMFQKVFFGKLDKARNGALKDLTGREYATFIPLVIGIFLMGMFPRPLLVVMEPSVQKFIRDFHKRVAEPDGPPHIYGSLPARQAPAQAQAQAQIQKNLDAAAKGAEGVGKALGGAK